MKKWPVLFSMECNGPVWNILSAYNSDELLFEVRLDSEEIEYHRLNISSFCSFSKIFQETPWMSHVVFFTPDLFILQEYDEDQNPDEVKLIAIDWDGNRLWQTSHVRINRVTSKGLELNTSQVIDPKSGKESKEDILNPGPKLEFPSHYRDGEEYYDQVREFIQSKTGDGSVRAIDYYEINDRAVISYYVQQENALGLRLLGIDSDGNIEFSENLGDDLQGIADPTFLISEMNIIFVKEKQHFFVYGIPE